VAEDTEVSDTEVVLLPVPDSVSAAGLESGVNSGGTAAIEPGNFLDTAVPPTTTDAEHPTSSVVDVATSAGVDAAAVESSSTNRGGNISTTVRGSGRGKSASFPYVKPAGALRGRKSSSSGRELAAQNMSSATVQPACTAPDTAEFNSPHPPPRCRVQTRHNSAIRIHSADSAANSSVPCEPSTYGTSSNSNTVTARRRRVNSDAQGTRNADITDFSNSVGSVIQTAALSSSTKPAGNEPNNDGKSAAGKRRGRGRAKTATVNSEAEPCNTANVVIQSDSTAAVVQPAALQNQSLVASGEASDVVVTRRNRSKTVVPKTGNVTTRAAVSNKTSDGEAIVRKVAGGRSRLNEAEAGAHVGARKPGRPRSCGPRIPTTAAARRKRNVGDGNPPNVVPAEPSSEQTRSVDNAVELISDSSAASPLRPVTTWLSGPRTDIFGQGPHQLSPSAVNSVAGTSTVDGTVAVQSEAVANTSAPTVAPRCAFSLFPVQN